MMYNSESKKKKLKKKCVLTNAFIKVKAQHGYAGNLLILHSTA